MSKLSFSRQILPLLAVIAIIVTAILIFTNLPDRSMGEPEIEPPRSPDAQSESGSVAGTGVVEPSSELVEIGPHLSGVVDRVYVAAGDVVTQGQPLFRVDIRDASARANEARARIAEADAGIAQARAQISSLRQQVSVAETQLRTASDQLNLYQRVDDPRAVSQLEVIERRGIRDNAREQRDLAQTRLSEANASLSAAQANRRSAQALLASAQTSLARHIVRAPMTGTVLQLNVRAGEVANAGPPMGGGADPLIVMGNTNPLHVRVAIDENEIDRLDIGAAAIISARGDAGRQIEASYVRTEPLVVPKTSLTNAATELVDVRVIELIYALPADGHQMFVGQQVDAFVPARNGNE